jgi:hypothetical protein
MNPRHAPAHGLSEALLERAIQLERLHEARWALIPIPNLKDVVLSKEIPNKWQQLRIPFEKPDKRNVIREMGLARREALLRGGERDDVLHGSQATKTIGPNDEAAAYRESLKLPLTKDARWLALIETPPGNGDDWNHLRGLFNGLL